MALNKAQLLKKKEAEDIVARLEQAMPQIHDLIAREDAVELLVHRVHDSSDFVSETRKKVNQRIDIALKNGELELVGDDFVFGVLINWAWTKKIWQPKLTDLPALNLLSGEACLPAIEVNGYCYALPATVDACHLALRDAYARIAQLEQEKAASQRG